MSDSDQRLRSSETYSAGGQSAFRTWVTASLPAHQFHDEPATTQASSATDDEEPLFTLLGNPRFVGEDQSRYELGERLGSGASGNVYTLWDRHLDHEVAVKVMHSRHLQSPHRTMRFVREARITARLEHPNILPIYNLDLSADGRPYILMRRVTGRSLDSLLAEAEKGPPPAHIATISDRCEVLIQVCHAIAYAHSRGVVHQDIKPGNIMLGDYGEVQVVDWGTAVRLDDPDRHAHLMGTPAYMSPEQARREACDERSDVYCLGATLFHLLSLRLPVRRGGIQEFWTKKRVGQIDALPPDVSERIPAYLRQVLDRALAPAASERYQSVGELQEALGAFLHHQDAIGICDRSALRLRLAEQGEADHETFNRLREDLRQAIELWPHDQRSQTLLAQVQRAQARFALSRGDLDLASSLVDHDSDAGLRHSIDRALRQRARQHRWLGWTRRIAALAVVVLLLSSLYVILDHLSQYGHWQTVWARDFTAFAAPTDGLSLHRTDHLVGTAPPTPGTEGLTLTSGEALWLTAVQEHGDLRVRARVTWPEAVDGFEIMLHAVRENPPSWWLWPVAYGCQFGGYQGSYHFINISHQAGANGVDNGVPAHIEAGRSYELTFEKQDQILSLSLDGTRIYSHDIHLPIGGEDANNIMLRSWGTVAIESLVVERLSLPAKASPLILGDGLLRRGHEREALTSYRQLAEDYPGTELAGRALARACHLAAHLERTAELSSCLWPLERDHQGTRWHRLGQEAACLLAWRLGRLDQALNMLESIQDQHPSCRTALELLNERPAIITLGQAQRLLAAIGRTEHLIALDLSGLGLSDLSPLAHSGLKRLNLSHNRVTDLSPLTTTAIETLILTDNQLRDLSPLTGMPLYNLSIDKNQIRDLSPLRGMPLSRLDASRNPLSDLRPLTHCPQLRILILNQTLISDLGPLASLSIRDFRCSESGIDSLAPLARWPDLRRLSATGLGIEDLSPLRGHPLIELNLSENRISDLSPLAGMDLEILDLTSNPLSDLTPLARTPIDELLLADCQLTSCAALLGQPWQILDLQDNQLSSVGPLEATSLDLRGNPLTSLASLSAAQIDTLHCDAATITDWSALPALSCTTFVPHLALDDTTARRRLIDLLTASQRFPLLREQLITDQLAALGKVAALLHRAIPLNGSSAVRLSMPLDHATSQALATRLGAHLPRPANPLAWNRLRQQVLGSTGCWLDITMADTGPQWGDGAPITFHHFNGKAFATLSRSTAVYSAGETGGWRWFGSQATTGPQGDPPLSTPVLVWDVTPDPTIPPETN